MDPIEKRELKRKAWMRLAAQKRRAGILRGRVVVMSLFCFAVLWGVVFAEMATGNDPVLSGKEKAAATRSVSGARRKVETADPRELEPRVQRKENDGAEVEEVEEVEVEPLVTSQS
jgi:non-ribosomal peptide synthetase component E (peptide arylation enzyme)